MKCPLCGNHGETTCYCSICRLGLFDPAYVPWRGYQSAANYVREYKANHPEQF